jgi:hypothetical protein
MHGNRALSRLSNLRPLSPMTRDALARIVVAPVAMDDLDSALVDRLQGRGLVEVTVGALAGSSRDTFVVQATQAGREEASSQVGQIGSSSQPNLQMA